MSPRHVVENRSSGQCAGHRSRRHDDRPMQPETRPEGGTVWASREGLRWKPASSIAQGMRARWIPVTAKPFPLCLRPQGTLATPRRGHSRATPQAAFRAPGAGVTHRPQSLGPISGVPSRFPPVQRRLLLGKPHEVWEELWHAHGRKGRDCGPAPWTDQARGRGVKVRERQPRGVATHAQRAAALFRSVQDRGGPAQLGLHLGELATLAQQIADDPPNDSSSPEDRVARVFAFNLEPRPCDPPEEARGP